MHRLLSPSLSLSAWIAEERHLRAVEALTAGEAAARSCVCLDYSPHMPRVLSRASPHASSGCV